MHKKRVLLTVTFVASVVVAGATAWSILDSVRWVEVVVLFFSGTAAGVTLKSLVDAPRTSRGRVDRVVAQPRGRGRAQATEPRGRRARSQRGTPKAQRTTGKVKWFDDAKGFGFIVPDNGKKECFVHRSAIQGGASLTEGKRVEFHVVTDDRGRRAAADVVKI